MPANPYSTRYADPTLYTRDGRLRSGCTAPPPPPPAGSLYTLRMQEKADRSTYQHSPDDYPAVQYSRTLISGYEGRGGARYAPRQSEQDHQEKRQAALQQSAVMQQQQQEDNTDSDPFFKFLGDIAKELHRIVPTGSDPAVDPCPKPYTIRLGGQQQSLPRLGNGKYGAVFSYDFNGRPACVKLSLANEDPQGLEAAHQAFAHALLREEQAKDKLLKWARVPRVYGHRNRIIQEPGAVTSHAVHFFHMEEIEGAQTLTAAMQQGGCLQHEGNQPRRKFLMRLIAAIELFKFHGLLHLDLHTNNILVVQDYERNFIPVIIDWGFSVRCHESDKGNIMEIDIAWPAHDPRTDGRVRSMSQLCGIAVRKLETVIATVTKKDRRELEDLKDFGPLKELRKVYEETRHSRQPITHMYT